MLRQEGSPCTGDAEVQPTLWSALNGGTQVAAHRPATMVVGVTNGLFTASFDFGDTPLNGQALWLQVEVRTRFETFVTLTPRQKLASTPYAAFAFNAASACAVPDGTITSAMIANGAVTAAPIASNSITAGPLAAGAVGLPQLAKPYQSGRIPSGALPVGFGDYVLVTSFPVSAWASCPQGPARAVRPRWRQCWSPPATSPHRSPRRRSISRA